MPLAKGNYRIDVRIGSHVWSVTDQDVAADPGLVGKLADGLNISRGIPDGVPLPWQPDPAVASVNVTARSAAALGDVKEGDVVNIGYRSPRTASTYLEYFAGRVTDAQLAPVNFGPAPGDPLGPDRLGALLAVTAVDFHADLAGRNVDLGVIQETALQRFARIRTLGITPYAETLNWSAGVNPPAGGGDELAAVAPGGASVRDLLDNLFKSWAAAAADDDTQPGPFNAYSAYRPVLRQVVNTVTGTLTGWEAELVTNWQTGALAPFVFGQDGWVPGWGVKWDPAVSGPAGVPAGFVDFGSVWSRTKGDPNQLAITYVDYVSGNVLTAYRGNGETPVVAFPLDTPIRGGAPLGLGTVYLTPASPDAWEAGEYVYYVGRAGPGAYLPSSGLDNGVLGQLVAVANVNRAVNPNDREWTAGVVRSYSLQVDEGQPVVRFRLASAQQRVRALSGGIAWDQLPAGVTWDQLNNRDSWDDYRLIREAD